MHRPRGSRVRALRTSTGQGCCCTASCNCGKRPCSSRQVSTAKFESFDDKDCECSNKCETLVERHLPESVRYARLSKKVMKKPSVPWRHADSTRGCGKIEYRSIWATGHGKRSCGVIQFQTGRSGNLGGRLSSAPTSTS